MKDLNNYIKIRKQKTLRIILEFYHIIFSIKSDSAIFGHCTNKASISLVQILTSIITIK